MPDKIYPIRFLPGVMNKPNIKVVVFDLGNVLIPFDHTIAASRFNEISPGAGERYLLFYKKHYEKHRDFERGDISENEFIDFCLNYMNLKIEREVFGRIASEIFTVNTNVTELLPHLVKKYRLMLLSNTNSMHREYGWKQYQFLQHFEKLFLSHEVRAVKPEPAIYQAVTDYTKEAPESHFFIDDVAEYIQGARNAGWHGAQFKGYEMLTADLKISGIVQ